MKLKYRSICGRFEVDFDEPDNQSMFEKIAAFQEVFESDTNVSIDGNEVPVKDIKLRVRGSGDNKFYEAVYTGSNKRLMGYRLDYSCSKDGSVIFPKRKGKDGAVIPNNGWYKYVAAEPVEKTARSTEDITKKAPY